jgi:type II secretory pathway pseudopilin PulG
MFFKNLLNSRAGMSLVEMTLVAALVGLGALGVVSLSGNLQKSSKRSEGVVAKTLFTSSLSTYLYSPLGCDDLKVSNGGGAIFSDTPQDIILTKWNYLGVPNIRGGFDGNNNKYTNFSHFDLDSLKASYSPVMPGSGKVTSLLADGSKMELDKSMLNIQAVLKVGNRSYTHVYNIPVLTSSGELKFCSDEMTVAETCAAMKGIYNPTTKECALSEGCLMRDTYITLSCDTPPCDTRLGLAKNNKYTASQSCPADSTAVKTHGTNWTSTISCGKKCTSTINNQMEWFSCMSCPP